ncbi:MAG: phospholipid carrier-dependent glycosyltransferase [Planctomycetota bacterium]
MGLLAVNAVLAFSSLATDSITFDETSHLTVGMSYWKTGDYRYTADHPPFGKLWATLPLRFVDHNWPGPGHGDWITPDSFKLGREWLFVLNKEEGHGLLVLARAMVVMLLLGTCLATYALARRAWGPRAGLLALTLAALSPTLLAHGRLVTTDMPIALFTALALLCCARLVERVTWVRVALAGVALAGASLAKLSWPLILPGVAAMAIAAIVRKRPLDVRLRPVWRGGESEPAGQQADVAGAGVAGRLARVLVVFGLAVVLALTIWIGIWTGYGWRYSMLAPLPPDATAEARAARAQTLEVLTRDRGRTVLGGRGAAQGGIVPAVLRFADRNHLLPETYTLGLAQTLQWTGGRKAYLMGQYSGTGWRSYFPIAFAIKTPVGTQLLILAGLAAMLLRRARPRDGALVLGLGVYAVIFTASVLNARLNIGHRHLLPLYPVLFVFGGAAAAWLTARAGQVLIGMTLVWLAGANLWIHPNYLAYFNELIGGPARGHLWLADANIDWGQDLIRLRDYALAHPDRPVKLAYFGSALPTYYLPCTALPSHHKFLPPAELTPGLYAISVTQLLGVYFEEARDDHWERATARAQYAALAQRAAALPHAGERLTPDQAAIADAYRELAAWRLISRLRHRPLDAVAGYSIFIYDLQQEELNELLKP